VEDVEGLLPGAAGLGGVAGGVVGVAEVGESDGFVVEGAEFPGDAKRLFEVAGRLLMVKVLGTSGATRIKAPSPRSSR